MERKKIALPHLDEPMVLEIYSYPADVVYKMKRKVGMYMGMREKRTEIKGFSHSSARKLSFNIRNSGCIWTTLLTLTYPMEFPSEGPQCKYHLRCFLETLRREKLQYAWVLEFQERGAPHFHLLLSGDLDKDFVARRWYEIVGSGDEKHLAAGTRIERIRKPDAAPSYMANYAAKLSQKTVPDSFKRVGRFWGTTRLTKKGVIAIHGTYRELAAYLRYPRRWYRSHSINEWGFMWAWKGLGFVLRDGARLLNGEVIAPKADSDV